MVPETWLREISWQKCDLKHLAVDRAWSLGMEVEVPLTMSLPLLPLHGCEPFPWAFTDPLPSPDSHAKGVSIPIGLLEVQAQKALDWDHPLLLCQNSPLSVFFLL